ncbi:hypothetical protein FRB96_004243 [Tulasnella sp. 330]|nr:hypothetical protein FRB96_004243 [Tulasnella sp. 330]KAG8880675.1 hypothetical protein FRB98_004951 [Tulasnella sp. 332]
MFNHICVPTFITFALSVLLLLAPFATAVPIPGRLSRLRGPTTSEMLKDTKFRVENGSVTEEEMGRLYEKTTTSRRIKNKEAAMKIFLTQKEKEKEQAEQLFLLQKEQEARQKRLDRQNRTPGQVDAQTKKNAAKFAKDKYSRNLARVQLDAWLAQQMKEEAIKEEWGKPFSGSQRFHQLDY